MSATMVRDIIATEAGEHTAGAIVYWRLAGDVPTLALRQALESRGLATLRPRHQSDEVALRRALATVERAGATRILARPLGGGRGRWALVWETPREGSLAHQVMLHAATGPTLANMGMGLDAFAAIEARIRAAYDHAIGVLAPVDVSTWLTRTIIPALDAVSLRDTGGMYFVPRAQLPLLDAVCDALGSAGAAHTVYRIPAMHSADAADAVLAAIEDEAAKEIAAVETALSGELSDRARKSHQETMFHVRDKLTRYEDLFGRRLDRIGARLGKVRNAIAGVTFKAELAAEGRPVEPIDPDDAAVNRFRVLELDDAHTPAPTAESDAGPVRPLDLD